TWLGFAACADGEEEEERWLEYGTPYATHEIKGKVVDAENESKPVVGIQVVVRGLEDSNQRPDTLFTDRSGEFTTLQPGFKLYEKYRVYYEEVA
ncbi:MAG: radical SAM-associated putative lipoprotein, partial [Bacteroides sp.]|nr:radical SAM-associated putative lipoprotein [Bacteroides sp.]